MATKAMFYRALEEILPVAERHGTVLALEPFVNNVVATLDDVDDVMRRDPTVALGLVFDPFNLISSELLPLSAAISAEFRRRWSHRFAIEHLEDVSACGAEIDTPAFGEGVFPHSAIFPFLRDVRPDLVVGLEHINMKRIPVAMQRFRALEAIVAKAQ